MLKHAMGVAILTPVPATIIGSALRTCQREGVVAFGTNAVDVFRTVDEQYGPGIPVIIHPTLRYGDPDGCGRKSFAAVYAGFTRATAQGLHPNPAQRPSVTLSPEDPDTPVFGFWEVTDLKELPSKVALGRLTAMGRKTPLPATYAFRGPLIVKADFL